MEQKKEKGLRIRSCLTGAIWLALVFSTVISALLFAFLNHFFNLPGSIPVLGWLLIFNTLIAGLITSFINAKLLEPITRLSKAMKEVSRGDFEQHLETNSRIAEVGESYRSFNVMTKELRATEVLQMDFVSDVSHEFKTPINAIEGYTMLLQGEELSPDQEEYVEKILFNTQRLSGLVGNILLLSKLENQNIPMKKTVEGLIKEAAFMRITLEELRDSINKYGVIDEMCQGEYTILRESPYVKTYNTMIQRYTTVNDKLLALLPKEVIKEVDDGFDSFIYGREDV